MPSPEEQVFAEHRERLLRYAESMVRDRAEAEDLLQEVMIRAHLGLGELRHGEALTSWLYRVTTNVCLDHLRQRGRRPPIEDGVDPASADVPEEESTSLQALAERKEMSACVQRFVNALPDEYRAVLILIEIEGLAGQEVADALGLPLTTVKMRLHRARRMIQAALEGGCAFERDARGVMVCVPKK